MTIPYQQALAAIKTKSTADLRQLFEPLPVAEATELGTFIGPVRLAAVAMQPVRTTASKPRPAPVDVAATLAEIARQAFPTGPAIPRPLNPDPTLGPQVTAALADLRLRRTVRPLLTITEDATGTLPVPAGVPPPLSDADYAAAAARENLEVAVIKAVAIVESGGRSGFDSQGRPKILFEAHHFGPLTGNKFDQTHPHLSCRRGDTATASRFYGWDQYERLREAMLLDVEAALEAASWGKFQVLGQFHDGWADVRAFVAAMYVSEANHLRAFEAHCNAGGLFAFARRHDWLGFARGYNGRSQQGYDVRLAAAYRAAGGR